MATIKIILEEILNDVLNVEKKDILRENVNPINQIIRVKANSKMSRLALSSRTIMETNCMNYLKR